MLLGSEKHSRTLNTALIKIRNTFTCSMVIIDIRSDDFLYDISIKSHGNILKLTLDN